MGDYEARATPVGDLNPKTEAEEHDAVHPGQVPDDLRLAKTGFKRFNLKVAGKKGKPGRQEDQDLQELRGRRQRRQGASARPPGRATPSPSSTAPRTPTGAASPRATSTRPSRSWPSTWPASARSKINRLQVSAMLNPAPAEPEVVPLAADPDSGSRFTALRQFALEVCVKDCTSASAKWRRVYASKANAFPAIGPRPVAPNLTLRSFKLQKAVKAPAVRLVAWRTSAPARRRTPGSRRTTRRRHRLQGGLRPRHDRARGRAPGLRQGAQEAKRDQAWAHDRAVTGAMSLASAGAHPCELRAPACVAASTAGGPPCTQSRSGY